MCHVYICDQLSENPTSLYVPHFMSSLLSEGNLWAVKVSAYLASTFGADKLEEENLYSTCTEKKLQVFMLMGHKSQSNGLRSWDLHQSVHHAFIKV